MSRTQRLLDLLQILRHHRFPVTGAYLAEKLGVSQRTLYRDIATLQSQGAHIEGEAGLGYVLRPGFMLPPLMFSEEEIEALVLGSRWVARRTDERLGGAARNALMKIAAVLPPDLRDSLDSSGLLIGKAEFTPPVVIDLSVLRHAIRAERRTEIAYCDLQGDESLRIIWPFALGFFDQTHVIAAWCELRQQFRHFRAERIRNIKVLEQRYPRRRQQLLKEWHEKEDIPQQ
ncbi:helix-turn-helix transcriptional regulator [Pectobacterium actinidiae]|uniref:Helix-turn-helix transcriptional regulator n=1 Tax=Pectobacterium actinidiae TaxID=1507808 RepID=A0ABW8G798_9GAMM